ncbi:hypothetical protein BDC45DRAFT_529384 [Circinella umbellata]|nr:hypothetical protein BDC45DRAFT_529384 [Circinella umbellata]
MLNVLYVKCSTMEHFRVHSCSSVNIIQLYMVSEKKLFVLENHEKSNRDTMMLYVTNSMRYDNNMKMVYCVITIWVLTYLFFAALMYAPLKRRADNIPPRGCNIKI